MIGIKEGYKTSELYFYASIVLAGLYEFIVSSNTGISTKDILSPVQVIAELNKINQGSVNVDAVMSIVNQVNESSIKLSESHTEGTTGIVFSMLAAVLYNIKRVFLKYQQMKMVIGSSSKVDEVKNTNDKLVVEDK